MLWADDTPWIDEHPIHTASFFSLLDHEKDLMAIHHAGCLTSNTLTTQLEHVSSKCLFLDMPLRQSRATLQLVKMFFTASTLSHSYRFGWTYIMSPTDTPVSYLQVNHGPELWQHLSLPVVG